MKIIQFYLRIIHFYLRLVYVRKLEGICRLIESFNYAEWNEKRGEKLLNKVENFIKNTGLSFLDFLTMLNCMPKTTYEGEFFEYKTDLEVVISSCLLYMLEQELSSANCTLSRQTVGFIFDSTDGYMVGNKIIELGLDRLFNARPKSPDGLEAARFFADSPSQIFELYEKEHSKYLQ